MPARVRTAPPLSWFHAFTNSSLGGLALLFLLAAGLRIATIVSFARDLRMQDPILDARYYLDVATRLSVGQGWPPGPLFMSPLFPWLLSGLFRATPATPLTAHVALALLGLASMALLFRAVDRDFGRAPAWAAAFLFVLFGPILAMEGQVLTESLLLFLALAAINLWPDRRGALWIDLGFGFAGGLLAIGRGVFLLLPLTAVGIMLARDRSGLAWRRAGTIAAGVLLALLPLIAYQTKASGRLEILTLNGGMNLYLGNNPAARGIYSLPPEIDLEKDPTAARSASILAGRTLNLVQSDRYWRDRAIASLAANPGRALWLFARKAELYFSPVEIPQIEDFQVLAKAHWPLRVALLRFGWILPLAVMGVIGLPKERRARLVPWLGLIAVGLVSTVIFFATGRYRIPVIGAFLGLAGIGLVIVIDAVKRRRRLLLVLPLVIAIELLLPRYSTPKAEAFDAYQLGLRYQRQNRLTEALSSMRRSTEIEPDDATHWHGVGAVLVRMGRMDDAAESYRRAIALDPRSPQTHYNLAIVLARGGREDLALEEFRQAITLDPLDPQVRSDYGVALARSGRPDDAIAQWEEALRLSPGYEPARRGLASVRPGPTGTPPPR